MKNPALAVTGTGFAARAAESKHTRNIRFSADGRPVPDPSVSDAGALSRRVSLFEGATRPEMPHRRLRPKLTRRAAAYFAEYAAVHRLVQSLVHGVAAWRAAR